MLWDYHKSRIPQWIVRKIASCHLRKAEKQIYTIDDIATYSKLSQKRLDEMLLLERYDRRKENFEMLRGVKFPQHIPILFILSSYGCKKMCYWYTIHEKMLQHSIGKIVTLQGQKDFYLREYLLCLKHRSFWCCVDAGSCNMQPIKQDCN